MGRPRKNPEAKVGEVLDATLPPELEAEIKEENVTPFEGEVVETKSIVEGIPLGEVPTIRVDKLLFYKIFASCVKGSPCTGVAAVRWFGGALGAKDYESQKIEWQKAQDYLREHSK